MGSDRRSRSNSVWQTLAVYLSLAAGLSAQNLPTVGAQRLERIKWTTPIDLAPQSDVLHGSPLVTATNTVIVPVRTTSSNTYRVEAHSGADGALLYTLPTDFTPSPHNRFPVYAPALSQGRRLYYAGAGGTISYRDEPDSVTGPSGQIAFYGNAVYGANQAAFNSTVMISTPIAADANGTIYFGFEVMGATPANLTSGLARIGADGTGRWISASAAAQGDTSIVQVALNCAPAVSNDGSTLYFGVSEGPAGPGYRSGYLVAVNSTTLAPVGRIRLTDPETGGDASVADSTSPTVGSDGDVYYGARLHFDRDLTVTKTPGAFGDRAYTPIAIGADGTVYAIDGATLFAVGQASNLTISASHAGSFTQGQNGASYSLTATNSGSGASNGIVTVTDTLPAGLTATAIAGQGWDCMQPAGPCTRSDALTAGAGYPALTLTVNVAGNAPATVTNTATISSDGSVNSVNSIAGDVTEIVPLRAANISHYRPNIGGSLSIATGSVPEVTQYQSYSTTLTATGGLPPYTWSVVSSTGASLPEGMSLNPATGVVSAAQVNGQGGYAVTVQATDSALSVATATLNFGVYSDTGLGGCQMFPADSIYNQRIDLLPVDTNLSDQIPASSLSRPLHPDFGHGFYPTPGGIPWMRVPANQPGTNVNLAYDGQIDAAGTYGWPFPAWPNAVIEGTSYGEDGDDHHVLILQSSVNDINGPQTGPCTLYETYQSSAVQSMYDAGSKTWSMDAGVHYVLDSNTIATSSATLDNGAQDSPGIPLVPLLIRYSEVPLGVQHPLRITFPSPTDWFAWPATGCCSGNGPPQGLLYRLKASVNWQAVCPASTNPQAATVLQALQQYGAYMSDHGSAGYIQGVPDIRWDDDDLACIKQFPVSSLEVVENSALEVSALSGQTKPYVVPATLANGAVGAPYSVTIAAVGGNPASRHWSISSGALPPGLTLNGSTGTIGGTPSSLVGSPYTFSITATDTASGLSSAAQVFAIGGSGPGLTIGMSHAGSFTQGQTWATYGISVGNSGSAPTSGTVTVKESIPDGLTLVSMSGGATWKCTVLPYCTTGTVLKAGSSYPAIAVTVNVATNAPASLTNQASVSGGSSAPANASDLTAIAQMGGCVSAVQLIINQALGVALAVSDLNQDGAVNVADVQNAIQTALGSGCSGS